MQVPDNWISEAISATVAACVGGVAWAIKNTWGRIRRLEDCTVRKAEFSALERTVVTKDVFEERAQRAEVDRQELREGIVKLFDKVDEIKTILIQKNTDG